MKCKGLIPHHLQFVDLHTLSSESADGAGFGEAFASIRKEK